MELITLNTWGGKLWSKMSPFLAEHSSADIFCFQEVNKSNNAVKEGEVPDLYEKISQALPQHKGYFHPQVEGIGLATFVLNEYSVNYSEARVVLSSQEIKHSPITDEWPNEWNPYPRILQIIQTEDPQLVIYNFHGIPGAEKSDVPIRDTQANKLIDMLAKSSPKILAGDLNANPDTRGVTEIEKSLTNLIKKNNVKTTRSRHYSSIEEQPFADYIFVSSGIEVSEFEVMQDEVSDHLPLRVKFNLQKS